MAHPSRAAAVALAACTLASCTRVRSLFTCVDAMAPPAYDLVQRVGSYTSRFSRASVGYVLAYPDRAEPKDCDRVAYLFPDTGGTAEAALAPLGFGGALRKYANQHGAFALLAIDAIRQDPEVLVASELSALAVSLTGVAAAREALLGIGIGAERALVAAERVPLRYAAVAVAGPPFARPDALTGAAKLESRPVLVRAGQSDHAVDRVRSFATSCPTARVEIVRGCHDAGFWRASADEMVAFVADRLFA